MEYVSGDECIPDNIWITGLTMKYRICRKLSSAGLPCSEITSRLKSLKKNGLFLTLKAAGGQGRWVLITTFGNFSLAIPPVMI